MRLAEKVWLPHAYFDTRLVRGAVIARAVGKRQHLNEGRKLSAWNILEGRSRAQQPDAASTRRSRGGSEERPHQYRSLCLRTHHAYQAGCGISDFCGLGRFTRRQSEQCW